MQRKMWSGVLPTVGPCPEPQGAAWPVPSSQLASYLWPLHGGSLPEGLQVSSSCPTPKVTPQYSPSVPRGEQRRRKQSDL